MKIEVQPDGHATQVGLVGPWPVLICRTAPGRRLSKQTSHSATAWLAGMHAACPLTCSGCVTSAESILVAEQSHAEVVRVLQECNAARAVFAMFVC